MKRSFNLRGLVDREDLEGPISDVIKRLQQCREKYPNAVLDLDIEDYYGSTIIEVSAHEFREETDEERVKREKHEADLRRMSDERDRQTLASLKKKFGEV